MDSCEGLGLFEDIGSLINNRLQHTMLQLPVQQKKESRMDTSLTPTNFDEENFELEFGELNNNSKKPKPKAKASKSGSQTRKKKKEANVDKVIDITCENEAPSQVAVSSTERCLSPVSQMLLEEEQRKQEKGPKAKRPTRRRNSKRRGSADVISFNEVQTTEPSSRVTRNRSKKKTSNKVSSNGVCAPAAFLELAEPFEGASPACIQARNEYLAEIAARAQTVATIDLVTAVAPRLEAYISLDSDDEASNQKTGTPSIAGQLESSFDIDNPQMSIKIRWNGESEKYTLRKYQKFIHLINELAERKQVPPNDVVLTLNYNFIKPDDTPDSIGYKIFHFIDGRAMKFTDEEASYGIGTVSSRKTNAKSHKKAFHLKVQSDKWKNPLVIELKKSDKFKLLYIKCAEELDLHISQFKLSFDGEVLDFDDTPEILELEGGEVIDCRIIQM